MMNEIRYRLSGRIQRNGTTATSWQIWFVAATRLIEPNAGNRIHKPSSSDRQGLGLNTLFHFGRRCAEGRFQRAIIKAMPPLRMA